MCLTPEAEQALYEAADDACEWGSTHVRDACCTGKCNQGRDCTQRNVIDFQSRAGLHRAFMPGGNSSGSRFIDFLTFWQIRAPLWFGQIDWDGVAIGALLVLSVVAFFVALAALIVLNGYGPLALKILAAIGAAVALAIRT